MPESKSITSKEAAVLLGVSDRTVRRYVAKGLLDKTYVDGIYGKELRLDRDQVLKLADQNLSRAREDGQEGPDQRGRGANNRYILDVVQLWEKLEKAQADKEQAVARLGYVQGKLDAQQEEIKLLTSRAQSLAEERQKAQEVLSKAEAEKRAVQKVMEDKERDYQIQIRRLGLFYTAILLLIVTLAFIFSPVLARILQSLLS